MPLIDKIENNDGLIGIWELSETAGDLARQCKLSQNEKAQLASFKFEKRQKEFVASRLLLQHLLPEPGEISYLQPSGKPVLNPRSLNISISHSATLATVYLSEKNIGIDVEQINRNIDRVVKRFVHPSETSFLQQSDDPQFPKILLWSAKEAIFKCAGIQGVQFNEQIIIPPFNYRQQCEFSGKLIYPDGIITFGLSFRIIKDNVLVYCFQQ
ncbi:4'-phosphopantetheinyl transferase superfamily protein [uncultured Draconibacterium sp.]|uniref:4'-phosphopantetheinyl transferase family protein n=1 Tax=uncultured Draconibacterium sp. TaxID=1573823 RepID=UPI0032611C5B